MVPLHAAGLYRKGEHPWSLHRVLPPTMTALIRVRRRNPSNSETEQKHFVSISQAIAAGESELLSVGTELNIGQRVDGLATFTRIDGEESCTSKVIEELGKNEWVGVMVSQIGNGRSSPRSFCTMDTLQSDA